MDHGHARPARQHHHVLVQQQSAADGHTLELTPDTIAYTGFAPPDGKGGRPPSRFIVFNYESKTPDVRTLYTGGMEVKSSQRVESITLQSEGAIVRTYQFAYKQSNVTDRTLLTSMQECGADGVCKPATTFQYSHGKAGFEQISTSIPGPTSKKASPMFLDINGDGLDDLLVLDVDPVSDYGLQGGLATTDWNVALNRGPKAPKVFSSSGFVSSFTEAVVEVAAGHARGRHPGARHGHRLQPRRADGRLPPRPLQREHDMVRCDSRSEAPTARSGTRSRSTRGSRHRFRSNPRGRGSFVTRATPDSRCTSRTSTATACPISSSAAITASSPTERSRPPRGTCTSGRRGAGVERAGVGGGGHEDRRALGLPV